MWFLPLVGILGTVLGFCFMTLSIASGLYYLSELVEEHTVIAKRVLSNLIYLIISIQLILCVVDHFPLWPTLLGVFSHLVYLGNLRRFPIVQLTDPLFLLSCALVVLNHYVWFRHFSAAQQNAYRNMSSFYDTPSNVPTFTEIASFFGICVWFVPFALFVSLSASDNVLPTTFSNNNSSVSSDGDKGKRSQGMAKALVDTVRNAIATAGSATGLKSQDKSL